MIFYFSVFFLDLIYTFDFVKTLFQRLKKIIIKSRMFLKLKLGCEKSVHLAIRMIISSAMPKDLNNW